MFVSNLNLYLQIKHIITSISCLFDGGRRIVGNEVLAVIWGLQYNKVYAGFSYKLVIFI